MNTVPNDGQVPPLGVDDLLFMATDPAGVVNFQAAHVQVNHIGFMERLIQDCEGLMLFVPGIGWHLYRGSVWEPDESNDALAMTSVIPRRLQIDHEHRVFGDVAPRTFNGWLKDASSLKTREAVLKLTAADRRMKVLARELNRNPMLLAVKNGTLDLNTGRLKDSDPKDYITQRADVHFTLGARCPEWDKHVRTITQRKDGTPDPEMYDFLQRWAGYSLTGLVDQQKFPFLWGDGNNGKNVFIETLMAMLGTYAIKGAAKLLTGSGQEHETVIADLAGARLVFIDETPKGSINEARVKELTGSKKIKARKMRADYFTYDARFKLWISGNNRPKVNDTTDGFWRRLDLIPFDYTIPADKRVMGFGDQLLNELPGILNWCLDGLRAYQEKELLVPERVRAAGESYREAENVFGQCVSEMFDKESTQRAWIPNKVIHALYVQWCNEQGILKPLSMQQLKDDLKREGFQPCASKVRVQWPIQAGTRPERGWFGPPPLEIPPGMTWTANTASLIPDFES